MAIHVVKQGECLARIAQRYKFSDWRTIYNHAQNAELRRRRPNPNILYPGDRIFIPAMTLRYEPRATDQRHRFRRLRPSRVLRIAVEGPEGRRLDNRDYVLRLGQREFSGTTDADGLLEEQIPIDAQRGSLSVGPYRWDVEVASLNPLENARNDAGVSGAQGRLRNLGFDVGAVDGDLGPRTATALRAFQHEFGLNESGDLDDATRARLAEIHGC